MNEQWMGVVIWTAIAFAGWLPSIVNLIDTLSDFHLTRALSGEPTAIVAQDEFLHALRLFAANSVALLIGIAGLVALMRTGDPHVSSTTEAQVLTVLVFGLEIATATMPVVHIVNRMRIIRRLHKDREK
ncbi:MAG: hypothetical protein KGL39_05520 [Patescibacteria group bacterium]|nr:hypothetical protein [Patescibacteria group bacterium]